MKKITEPWLLALFDFFEDSDYPCEDQLFMGVSTWDEETEKHGQRHFSIQANCNDLFAWACADCEDIKSLGDVELLKKAYSDTLKALEGGDLEKGMHWYQMLYAARKRKCRIQHGWYDKGYLPKELHALFNAVGEPRETGFGNPRFEDKSAADLPST